MPTKQRKIALMGYRSVGKSSLTIQFVDGQFVESYDPTIENTFVKNVKLRGQDYGLRLVDTAGQDEYSIFPQAYAIDIHGYCLVYSINNMKSFDVVRVIYEKLLDMTGKVHVPIILVGNKLDLQHERVVSVEMGKELANKMKADFVEVSAKDNGAVIDLFNKLIISIEKGGHDTTDGSNDKSGNKCLIQ
ncbi:GTP-binding protein Rheb-like [Oppia nitens]|uniref:GTP-binding protein Rheb-like n=1 Tax=Oppia nitens TaxID=1686743 RepID=UPI0023DBDE9B|nr:GTP-binding protein Rheb-like [Oppia nitens]XP_054160782.1 GTP-binding protein Rheb-like [Oppia nitens]